MEQLEIACKASVGRERVEFGDAVWSKVGCMLQVEKQLVRPVDPREAILVTILTSREGQSDTAGERNAWNMHGSAGCMHSK